MASDDWNELFMKARANVYCWPQFVEVVQAPLLRYVNRIVCHIETARDLVQQTFLQVFRHLDNYDKEKATVKTWVFRIATNLAYEDRRKQRRRRTFTVDFADPQPNNDQARVRPSAPISAEPDPAERAAAIDAWNHVETLLSRLTENERASIMLELEGLGIEEVADILGITANAVRINICRGKQKLRELVGEVEEVRERKTPRRTRGRPRKQRTPPEQRS